MDSHTIFSRTPKGEDEMRNKSAHLVGDIRRALLMVDGTATYGEISKRAAPSLRSVLDEMFKELEKGGFIQDKARSGHIPKMVVPHKMSTPLKKPADEGASELDFTAAFRAPSADMLAAEAKKAETAKIKIEAEAKARAEAEAKARQEIEAVKLKARQEAEAARQKAEQEAARVRAELDAARAKAEAEAKARVLAEAKARQETEAARIRAEAKARQEIEEAKLKAQREAEEARLRAEKEAARAREEAELAKQKALAEAKAREEAERRARAEAEAARVKAEQEAARVRAELEAAKAKAEAEAKAREEAERRVREEAEAARSKAQQEAEAARLKAEQEAAKAREEAELAKQKAAAEAKAREEAERRAREEAEAVRVQAEQEAARVRAELEMEKAKAEAEAKAREEAERRAREEADAAKLKEQQEGKAREEAELARQKAETESRVREETEQRAKEEAGAAAGLKVRQEAEAHRSRTGAYQAARSTSATVLFFDVVGYTKQPVNKQIEIKKQFNRLVSECLEALGDGERIILDTGDGAAIGFMQHPEDALEVAMQFRQAVMADRDSDYPDLKVRIGIHLGPINVAKDMNGRSNMVGDGINDAQRVMSFAGIDQIYISRPYYDFVSRLSDEYANLFQYRGMQKDKHGREHPVYELMDAAAPVAEAALPQAGEPAFAIKLEPFSFAMPEAAMPPAPVAAQEEQEPIAAQLISDIGRLNQPEEAEKQVEEIAHPPPAAPSPTASVSGTPPDRKSVV